MGVDRKRGVDTAGVNISNRDVLGTSRSTQIPCGTLIIASAAVREGNRRVEIDFRVRCSICRRGGHGGAEHGVCNETKADGAFIGIVFKAYTRNFFSAKAGRENLPKDRKRRTFITDVIPP